jgi:ElaB/YqjD/DUF883 family membrane-anchored ribosome-binding protein
MKTNEMSEKLQDWQRRVGEKAKDVGRATDVYVRKNAWSTLAFATILGCALGLLLANRKG